MAVNGIYWISDSEWISMVLVLVNAPPTTRTHTTGMMGVAL